MRYLRRVIISFLLGAVIFCTYEGIQQLVNGMPFVYDIMTVGRYLVAAGFGGLVGVFFGLANLRLALALERIRDHKEQLEHLLAVSALDMEQEIRPAANQPESREFDDYLDGEWRRAIRHQKPITLVLCAVDVMDDATGDLNYGDHLEDLLNKWVKRPADMVIRYSDRTVLLMLPETSVEGATRFVEMLRQEINDQPVSPMDVPLSEIAQISIGLASGIPIQGYHPEQMIEAVEKALEQSRREGFIIIDRPFKP